MWQIITQGHVALPTGRTWIVEPRDWLETVKWFYEYADPPRQRVDVAGVPRAPVGVKHDLSDDAVANLLNILAGLGALQPGAKESGDAQTE